MPLLRLVQGKFSIVLGCKVLSSAELAVSTSFRLHPNISVSHLLRSLLCLLLLLLLCCLLGLESFLFSLLCPLFLLVVGQRGAVRAMCVEARRLVVNILLARLCSGTHTRYTHLSSSPSAAGTTGLVSSGLGGAAAASDMMLVV